MSPPASASSPIKGGPRNPTARRRGRKGKSIYRGVCVTREGKWRAVIYKERKQLYLGVFESEIDAAKAHDRAARYHFGAQAMVNFLEPTDPEYMQHIPPPQEPEDEESTAHLGGTISPVSSTAKLARSAVKVEGKFAPFQPSLMDFAFPFDDSSEDDLNSAHDLGAFDMSDDVGDFPLLDGGHEPFGASLSFLGTADELAADLCTA